MNYLARFFPFDFAASITCLTARRFFVFGDPFDFFFGPSVVSLFAILYVFITNIRIVYVKYTNYTITGNIRT